MTSVTRVSYWGGEIGVGGGVNSTFLWWLEAEMGNPGAGTCILAPGLMIGRGVVLAADLAVAGVLFHFDVFVAAFREFGVLGELLIAGGGVAGAAIVVILLAGE
ncbi:MAG: hypothetical protein RI897_3138 [Verrucomicrobiota bacterium]